MNNVNKKYKFTVIATDTVLFAIKEGKLMVLLIKMNKEPFQDHWALPGGLVDAEESVDQSAVRVLREKAGVRNIYTEQLYTFGEIDRDPFGRVVSVAYLALTANPEIEIKTTAEHKEINWFAVDDLPKLAYDHKKIIKTAVKRLGSRIEYTNIIFKLLPKEFSMNDLQKAYEVIRGESLDKRNFQKKIFQLDLVDKINKKLIGQAHRPAQLYVAKKSTVEEVKIV